MTTSLSEIDVRAVTLLWSVREKKKIRKRNKNREKELDCAAAAAGTDCGTDEKICKSAFRCRSLSIRAGNILLTRHELHFFFSSSPFHYLLLFQKKKEKKM
jgi:hypothetical protein